jgi:hypothetical protein
MHRSELVTSAIVGGVGAMGQAMLLTHALESYPFRILNYPPGEFYASAGLILGFTAPALSLLALVTFRSTKTPFVTSIPVVACPLIFFVLFRLVFLLCGYQYPEVGSDLVATKAIETEFIQLTFWLTLFGIVIGFACGGVIKFLFSRIRYATIYEAE